MSELEISNSVANADPKRATVASANDTDSDEENGLSLTSQVDVEEVTVFQSQEKTYEWVDVLVNFTKREKFEEFIKGDRFRKKFNIDKRFIRLATSQNLLPRIEMATGNKFFIATRYADVYAQPQEDSVGSITNKIMIFIDEQRIITVHREKTPFLNRMMKKWDSSYADHTLDHLINNFLDLIIDTYNHMTDLGVEQVEIFEKQVLNNQHDIVEDLYRIKRKASIFKRMLKLTKEMILKYHKNFSQVVEATHGGSSAKLQSQNTQTNLNLKVHTDEKSQFSQELVEKCEAALFNSDELHESAMNMMNLYVTIASHKTNQLMTVLTIFSAYFIPLTFLAGIYGMNFDYMPELHWDGSYPLLVCVMIVISIIITILFIRKGLLPTPYSLVNGEINKAKEALAARRSRIKRD